MKNFPETSTISTAKSKSAISGNLNPFLLSLNKEVTIMAKRGVTIKKAKAVNL
ncbi:hypothetical protein KUN2590_13610 [Streptococcus pyogenes]|nr:hypothetical protein KUN2590_13610 [Streptococcus pyogenes]